MDGITIEQFSEAAAKVLHLDASHSALRQKLQGHVATEHRKSLAAKGSDTGYYDYPYVQDVYGTEDSGHVITSHNGMMQMHKFSKVSDGSYKLSGTKKVRQAYVADNDTDDKKESMTLVLDGRELEVQEAAQTLTETGEVVELTEAAKANGNARIKVTLITAGKGSTGYYSESALQKAAKNRIFPSGTQMFLNHQTKQEAAERPEGDITKLAATTKTDAVYVPGSNGQPGKLIAEAEVYPEYKGFIGSRKDDIGVSIRAGGSTNGTRDGVPLVENLLFARSVDFVTKAGRGGKIEELYESYRAAQPSVAGGNQPQENEAMTDQEKQELAALRAQVNRLQESDNVHRAGTILTEAAAGSGLKPRGLDRVKIVSMAVLPTKEDGSLDEVKFRESVKTVVAAEVAYLQENGVQTGATVVRMPSVVPTTKDDGTELSEAEVAANAQKLFEESVGVIAGKEKTGK